jgi:signal transduction histidine kinase/DNA-binding NarL/FixJ family response regulator
MSRSHLTTRTEESSPPHTRLLLLDPDPEEAARLTALLGDAGVAFYRVTHARDLQQAEQLLQEAEFELILLDLANPVDHFASLLQQMTILAADIPIVVLTQTEDINAGIMAVKAGAQDFLVKSRINSDVLHRVIRYSIDRLRYRQDVDGLAREIAHRQRIADALSESQNRMLAINESLYEGVLVFDETGLIALSNRAADRLLGDDGRLTSRTLDKVLKIKRGGQLLNFAEGPLLQVIDQSTGMQDDDAVMIRHDGKPLSVAYACTPLMEKDGVQGAILSFRDISAFKQAQRDALQASKLASVGQLAAGIAHEINTPIQYIGDNLGFLSDAFQTLAALLDQAETLLREGGDDAALARLQRAKDLADADFLLANIPEATRQSLEGTSQVARIVLAMKEFSHPGEKEKAEEDLNRAIENTLAVSRNEWKHIAKLETHLAADLPRVRCLGGEMNQVLLNLVVNAAHAIDEARRGADGRITVTTRQIGDMVEIIVEDNGIGMSEDVRSQIFDPFFTTKKVGKGTGQGLAICQDVVVAKHGGRITVDSLPGRGSRFAVLLPIGGNNGGSDEPVIDQL